MGTLKREKRMNKNGVMVTKLVRDDADATSNAAKAPAPTLKTGALNRDRERLLSCLPCAERADSRSVGTQILVRAAPVEVVTAALKVIDDYPDSGRVAHAVQRVLSDWEKEGAEQTVHDLPMTAVEAWYDRHLPPSPLGLPSRYGQISKGIWYGLTASEDDNAPGAVKPRTPEMYQAAPLLAHAAAAVDIHRRLNPNIRWTGTDDYYFLSEHPVLGSVFTEYPDRTEELVQMVITHGPDGFAARQRLRGGHLALADGAL